MSSINEIYSEIEDLEKKIEDEHRNRDKRKLIIEDEIERLEDEIKRSGLRGDLASAQQFRNQIKKLEYEFTGAQIYEYESEIKLSKQKLLNLLINYYEKGKCIEDIFQIENVSQNIQDDLLNKSNFGKNTGFLFIDKIDDENHNWRYYNPIFDIEYKSKTIDDLEYQIKSHNEVFLIFDKTIADKCRNIDLNLCQVRIDEYISDLKNHKAINDIFKNLKKIKDKFSEKQIMKLYEFLLEDTINYEFMVDFDEILKANLDKIDVDTQDKIYSSIIDYGIKQLDNHKYTSYDYIFSTFNLLSDKFSKNQIKRVYNYILENIKYSNKFNTILNNNSDKFSQEELDGIYNNLIENGIEKLETPNIRQNEIIDVFDYLNNYSSKFSSKQIQKLCTIVINNIYGFNKGFISILKDYDGEFDDIYKNIINQRINTLKDINSPSNTSKYLIKDLRYLANKFNETQLNKLIEVIISNPNICNFADDFKNILKTNYMKNNTIYEKIIDTRIKYLSSSNSGLSCIIGDLEVFAYNFNKTQINRFNEIIRDEKYISDCVESILRILSVNKNNLDENAHEKIIEITINENLNNLNNLRFGYRTARLILNDLVKYADSFNETQLKWLCDISNTNNQVYNCESCERSLKLILSKNKEKIDEEIYENTISKNNLKL